MKAILTAEICKEKPNSSALGAFNRAQSRMASYNKALANYSRAFDEYTKKASTMTDAQKSSARLVFRALSSAVDRVNPNLQKN